MEYGTTLVDGEMTADETAIQNAEAIQATDPLLGSK